MARILGLDIEPHVVRGTLLRSAFRSTEVLQYIEVPIARAEGPLPRAEAERQAIGAALGEIQPPPDQVIVALDGQEASLRQLELPAGAAKRLAEVIPFELDEVLPFEIEDSVLDHQPIRRTETMIHVLAAAVPKARLAERLAELGDAGLDPREIAVGAAALDGLVGLVPALAEGGPYVLVDIGLEKTEVCVLEAGACTFARTISGGLLQLQQGQQAALTASLRRTMAAYRMAGGAPPERVLLGGDGTLLGPPPPPPTPTEPPGPDDPLPAPPVPDETGTPNPTLRWLEEVLGAPAAFVTLPDAPGADWAVRGKHAMSTALAGRTLRRAKRIDLRQGEFAATQAMGALAANGKLLAIAAVPIALAFFFSIWARWTVLDDERTALREQLAEVTEDVFDERTASPSEARELLEGGRRVADPLPHFTAYDVLDAVSAAIPQEITHDTRRLTIEIDDEAREGRFEIQGIVASIAERDTIAANFEAHECFEEIKRGPTSPGPRNEGLNYRLEATIHCPGDEPVVQEESSRRRRRR
ncbi:MAG: hypothetical protein CMN31_15705 [Sandaracinus sp.]|nr:hypothetical protein [Sandaracinus sp.]